MGVMPVTTALLAHLFIKDEPFTGRTALALIIGFIGLVILLGADAMQGLTAPLIAQIAVLSSAICYGASATFTRYFGARSSGAVMASGTMITAVLWMTPITLMMEQPFNQAPTLAGLIAIGYLRYFPYRHCRTDLFLFDCPIGGEPVCSSELYSPGAGCTLGHSLFR